ncbi:MAG: prepilin-type N-terminal cleavage/methylation domain-containing protein [Actinomycetota bacterium]|nr:prepilin-type N-terminal cleavage/methylation domain-containing protein [Actinomycetota bacterium]
MAATPWSRRARADARRACAGAPLDDGFSLVEVLVALLVLALVVLPLTLVLITTHSSANTLHRRAEAADLATQALETAQYQAAAGAPLATGATTSTQMSGSDQFRVSLDLSILPQSGVGTLCTAPPGATSTEVWQATASVSWGSSGSSGSSVVERALISPAQADLANVSAGEIAVPVYTTVASSMSTTTTTSSPGSPAALPTTLETQTPISVTVTGRCTLASCAQPSGTPLPVTTETENTGSTGCAVFPNLWAATGWLYTVTVSGNAGWVDPSELSDSATATGVPTLAPMAITPDSVTQPTGQIVLDQGAAVTVDFSDTVNKSAVPAPFLPVTFVSPGACGSAGLCVLGNATTAFATVASSAQTALLFPFPSAGANYTVYAGGTSDADPSAAYYGTGGTVTRLTAGAAGSATVTLPLYPLSLTATVKSDAGSVIQLLAKDSAGNTIDLNYAGGTGASLTSLPLGEYEIGATVSGSNSNVTYSGGTAYMWVTPTGVCPSTSPLSPGTSVCSSPSTSQIAVTVG